ncbi:MAG: peroxiredoxin [Acidobacteriota bacterium]
MFPQIHLKEGDPAPELKLKDQHGNLVWLRDYLSKKWVVLYFYPKDHTPGCTQEACDLRDNMERLLEHEAQVVGVSVDDHESHGRFARKHGLNFPLLADPKKKVTRSYGALAFYRLARRMTFIIDQQGTIRKIFPKVNPKTHVEEVLRALQELKQRGA